MTVKIHLQCYYQHLTLFHFCRIYLAFGFTGVELLILSPGGNYAPNLPVMLKLFPLFREGANLYAEIIYTRVKNIHYVTRCRDSRSVKSRKTR